MPIVNRRYQGRSLQWARETLHKQVPRFPSARAMADLYKDKLVRNPERGMVCFFGDDLPNGVRLPNGDCGIYLGSGLVRVLDPNGNPYTLPLSQVRGTFLGAMHWPSVPEKVGETS